MADAHRRKFDVVVVWKFDRFARSVSHLLRALETFQSLGVEFVSLTEGVDTSTPAGKMVFTVLGAVAELAIKAVPGRRSPGRWNVQPRRRAERSKSWGKSTKVGVLPRMAKKGAA
jgi:DNA invertase Pin-like site-specific DNA recombinase